MKNKEKDLTKSKPLQIPTVCVNEHSFLFYTLVLYIYFGLSIVSVYLCYDS